MNAWILRSSHLCFIFHKHSFCLFTKFSNSCFVTGLISFRPIAILLLPVKLSACVINHLRTGLEYSLSGHLYKSKGFSYYSISLLKRGPIAASVIIPIITSLISWISSLVKSKGTISYPYASKASLAILIALLYAYVLGTVDNDSQ